MATMQRAPPKRHDSKTSAAGKPKDSNNSKPDSGKSKKSNKSNKSEKDKASNSAGKNRAFIAEPIGKIEIVGDKGQGEPNTRRYYLIKVLGSGTFGKVFQAQREDDLKEVAIKFIDTAAAPTHTDTFFNEVVAYKNIKEFHRVARSKMNKDQKIKQDSQWHDINLGSAPYHADHIPYLYFYGKAKYGSTIYYAMVISKLNPNPYGGTSWITAGAKAFAYKDKMMHLRSIVIMMHQTISRMEYVHRAGFLHMDFKPDKSVKLFISTMIDCGSLLMGKGKMKYSFVLVDFGFAVRYRRDGKFVDNGLESRGPWNCSLKAYAQKFPMGIYSDLSRLGHSAVMLARCKQHPVVDLHYYAYRDPKQKEAILAQAYELKRNRAKYCSGLPHRLWLDFFEYVDNMDARAVAGGNNSPNYNYLRSLVAKAYKDLEFDKYGPKVFQ